MSVRNRATRIWWSRVGREVDLDGEHAWLQAPMSDGPVVQDGWLASEAARLGGRVLHDVKGAGLVPDLSMLDGPGFAAADVAAQVRDFYQHTANWRMEVWSGWNPVFWPGGELISRVWGRPSEQLAIPMRPLDVAHGMDSRVSVLTDADGHQRAAGWLRKLRATGGYVYSGCYSHRRLPGRDRDSVHVAFPLESGNVQVFLRPDVEDDGTLRLTSPGEGFGGDGAYVVVRERGKTYAARAPLHEEFRVYVDPDGVLRTDHSLRLWSAPVVRLHYKLEPTA